jgi:energy-coupling factor transport system ATP-binding protein
VTADIVIEDLTFSFPPQSSDAAMDEENAPVLQGISFQVERGEFVALLSRVGAGKSTLCMALNGLVPHSTGGLFHGRVEVLGHDTRLHAVADLARFVGYIFQDPESQLTQMRVEDEIAFGLENLGVPSAEIEERVTWALEAVGLAEFRDRPPLLLSGGEQQRVAIASVIAMRPQILVLDEPTASLDPAGKAAVFGILADLRRRLNMTIFMATQEVERVSRYADRCLVLHNGSIVLDGTPAQVFSNVERLQEMGIGVPQYAELGHQLSRQTGRQYRFASNADALKQLRRRAIKYHLATRPVTRPPTITKANPLAERRTIELQNVSYQFDDGTPAITDVSLSLHPGDFLALLGPNGAGKTTLIRHFNGLLRPTTGRVMVEHRDTRAASVSELSSLVGYSFQNPDHQIFSPTVSEEVAFGLRMRSLPPTIIARRVAEVLDRFRLTACAAMPPALLGFGQRRKVALASVIAMQPVVLVLDEPTGGLDWSSRQELMEAVVAFHAIGRTVVLVTHDMQLVAEYATRAVVLNAGKIVFDGTPRELFADQKSLVQAQLALPPVTRLARRMRSLGLTELILTPAEFVAAWLDRLPARKVRKQRRSRTSDKGAV